MAKYVGPRSSGALRNQLRTITNHKLVLNLLLSDVNCEVSDRRAIFPVHGGGQLVYQRKIFYLAPKKVYLAENIFSSSEEILSSVENILSSLKIFYLAPNALKFFYLASKILYLAENIFSRFEQMLFSVENILSSVENILSSTKCIGNILSSAISVEISRI